MEAASCVVVLSLFAAKKDRQQRLVELRRSRPFENLHNQSPGLALSLLSKRTAIETVA